MHARIKSLIQQGKIEELKSIFKDKNNHSLIESITVDDFAILQKNNNNPCWEFAGLGISVQPFDPNYKYEMDINEYVVRYKRVPLIDSYDKCFEFVNTMRKKIGLSPLIIDSGISSAEELKGLNYNQILSKIFTKEIFTKKDVLKILLEERKSEKREFVTDSEFYNETPEDLNKNKAEVHHTLSSSAEHKGVIKRHKFT